MHNNFYISHLIFSNLAQDEYSLLMKKEKNVEVKKISENFYHSPSMKFGFSNIQYRSKLTVIEHILYADSSVKHYTGYIILICITSLWVYYYPYFTESKLKLRKFKAFTLNHNMLQTWIQIWIFGQISLFYLYHKIFLVGRYFLWMRSYRGIIIRAW